MARKKGRSNSGRGPTSLPSKELISSADFKTPDETRIERVGTGAPESGVGPPHFLAQELVPDRTDFPAFSYVERGRVQVSPKPAPAGSIYHFLENLFSGQVTIPPKWVGIAAIIGAVYGITQLFVADNQAGKLESAEGLVWLLIKCSCLLGLVTMAAGIALVLLAEMSARKKGAILFVSMLCFVGVGGGSMRWRSSGSQAEKPGVGPKTLAADEPAKAGSAAKVANPVDLPRQETPKPPTVDVPKQKEVNIGRPQKRNGQR